MSDPITRPATQDDVGRSCPYCRFPLKSGAQVVQCGDCSAVHHDDCWVEGEGCAITGCASGPRTGGPSAASSAPTAQALTRASGPDDAPTAPTAVHPTAGPPTGIASPGPPPQGAPLSGPPTGAWSQAPPPAAPPPSGGGRGGLIAAVLVLALAIVGGAAAIVLSGGDDGPSTGTQAARTTQPKPDGPTTAKGPATTTAPTGGTTTDAVPPTTDDPPTTSDVPPTTEDTPPAAPDRPANGQQRTTSSVGEGLVGAEHQTWRTDTNTGAMEQTLRRHWQARADGDYVKAHEFLTGSALRKAGTAEGWSRIASQDGLRRVTFDRVGRRSAGPSSGAVRVSLRTLDKDGCWRFDFDYAMVRDLGKWRISRATPLHARRATTGC